MPHGVVHFEIHGTDDGSLVAFYGGVFDWTLQSSTGGHTAVDTRGGGINGGIGTNSTGPWASFCVETDDPQAMLDKAVSLGGTAVVPVTDVDAMLTLAMFRDLDGLAVGLVRAPVALPDGSDPAAEPVDWFEVMGTDAVRTQQFYAELFDWKIDASFPGYGLVDTGGGRGIQGGIGGGADLYWAIAYAIVSDVDRALSRVAELGGSRLAAPGVGALKLAARTALYGSADDVRMETFRDPAGNIFGACQRVE